MDTTGAIEYLNKRFSRTKCPHHDECVEVEGDDNDLTNVKTLACCQEFLNEQTLKIQGFLKEFLLEKALGFKIKGEKIESGFSIGLSFDTTPNPDCILEIKVRLLSILTDWMNLISNEYKSYTSKSVNVQSERFQFALNFFEKVIYRVYNLNSLEEATGLHKLINYYINNLYSAPITTLNIMENNFK